MTDRAELEGILKRLEDAKSALVGALETAPSEGFTGPGSGGESLKDVLDRTIDDVNFYYGRLAARALNLPQPPCLLRADCGSLREATMSLNVAHRRFTNLLHDLIPGDLEKVATDAELGTFSLRQVLELAIAQYAVRSQQVSQLTAPR
jgi:hypothetical protein